MISSTARRVLLLIAAVAVAGLALAHLGTLGASWSGALARLTHLAWEWPVALGVVWLVGLWAHTIVLTAALPGLSHRRALTLNLSGSAVSNALPLGGVAGTALNLGMIRGWGHSGRDFARFTLVSKAWDVVAKLTLPVLAVAVLLGLDRLEPTLHAWAWLAGAGLSAAVGALLVVALLGRAGPVLRLVTRAERVLRRGRPERSGTWTNTVGAVLDGTETLVRRRWAPLTAGMAGYVALQGVLLWLCLAAVGVHLPVAVLFAVLVAERALSLLAVTPGGTGFVEAGAVALLVALGIDPTGALAGVLLYRAFIVFAEIPVGALATALWALGRRRRPAL